MKYNFVRFSLHDGLTYEGIKEKEFSNQKTKKEMEKPAKTFKDLIVWEKAHQFVLDTYNLTQKKKPMDYVRNLEGRQYL